MRRVIFLSLFESILSQPLTRELTPAAVVHTLDQPRPQDLQMKMSRDYMDRSTYKRSTSPDPGEVPYPIPLDYPIYPVGFQSSFDGPTTGLFTEASNTGPKSPESGDFSMDPGVNPGPVYPIYEADVPLSIDNVLGDVAQLEDLSTIPFPTPTYSSPSCNSSLLLACSQTLSSCLGAQCSPEPSLPLTANGLPALTYVKARGGLCNCYLAYGKCFDAPGCIEALPQDDVKYCHYSLNCPLLICQGNGTLSSVLHVLPIVAALVLALLVLL